MHAVDELRKEGADVGLINKPTLNVVDEEMMGDLLFGAPFVLVVESQNYNTGLGSRFGTWLAQRAQQVRCPLYDHIGVTKSGQGGLGEQVAYQGLDPGSIKQKIKAMLE